MYFRKIALGKSTRGWGRGVNVPPLRLELTAPATPLRLELKALKC